jgi:cell division protein ZapA
MAAMVDLSIAGRVYPVACREGEEESLRAAAKLVDSKSREALAGLGTLSEARQFLFASLLLADQLIDKKPEAATPARHALPDPVLASRADALAERLEVLADALENESANP